MQIHSVILLKCFKLENYPSYKTGIMYDSEKKTLKI